MYELLGPHLHSAGGAWVSDTYRWKPPVVLSFDHATAVADIIQHSPNTVIVGRMPGTNPDFGQPLDVAAVARMHVDATLPQAERMAHAYKFWQCCVNEPVLQTADAMQRYADYTYHVVVMLASEGFKAAVGHFSAGTPEFDLWPHFVPAMRVARDYGCPICVHEYDWPNLINPARWPWLLLRHRLVHDGSQETIDKWGWAGLPEDLKNMWWIVTEAGLDSGVAEPAQPFRGWRSAMSVQDYAYQLAVYSDELLKDPYVLGACLWDFGGGGQWATAEHWPEVSAILADLATPIYRWQDNGGEPGGEWAQVRESVEAIRALLPGSNIS